MRSNILLGGDQLRVIGHAINWRLNGTYEHSFPAPLSSSGRESLQVLFDWVCSLVKKCHTNDEIIVIESGDSLQNSLGQVFLLKSDVRLIADALTVFYDELRHSKDELEAITGVPISYTFELLSKFQKIV